MFIFQNMKNKFKKRPKSNEKITHFNFNYDPTVVSSLKINGKNLGVRSMGEWDNNFSENVKKTRGIMR